MTDSPSPVHTPPLPIPDLAAVKARSVPVATLIVAADIQPRTRLDTTHLRRLATLMRADPKAVPAITVGRLTDEPPWPEPLFVIDGFHRVAAAKELGVRAIMARVVEVDRKTASHMAVTANRKHGLPLSTRTDRPSFRRYMDARQNVGPDGNLKSYRTITEDLGYIKGKSTIHRWMGEMFPSIAAEMAGREEIESGRGPDEPDPWPEGEAKLEELAFLFGQVAKTLRAQEVTALGHRAASLKWGRQRVEQEATARTRVVVRLLAARVWTHSAALLGVGPEALFAEHEEWIAEHEDSLSDAPASSDF